METLEDIVKKIENNNHTISTLLKENNELSKKIKNYGNEEYMTITHACKKFDVSYRFLYNFVNTGRIKNYSAGNRILLKTSEVESFLIREV